MTSYVALLHAVNVGGTGKLQMSTLKKLCETVGFANVTTYIASGNVVFSSDGTESAVKNALEKALFAETGKAVKVCVRTSAEMQQVLASNPFKEQPRNQTVAIFLDLAPPNGILDGATGRVDEEITLGLREVYAFYPSGLGATKLKIPGAKAGTARNINTVVKLVDLSSKLD